MSAATWFLGPGGSKAQANVTMVMIATIRKWAEQSLGAKSELVIERNLGAERNRVALRFFLADGPLECDVTTLRELQKRRLKEPFLQQQLLEACQCVPA